MHGQQTFILKIVSKFVVSAMSADDLVLLDAHIVTGSMLAKCLC